MIKFLIKFASFLLSIAILGYAGYKTYTENRIEEMTAKLTTLFDGDLGIPGAPDNGATEPDLGGSDIGGDNDNSDLGGEDNADDPSDGGINNPGDEEIPEQPSGSSPSLSTQEAKDAFASFYDNNDPAFNDLNKEFFTGMLSGIFGMLGDNSGSGSDTPPVEDGDVDFDSIFNGDFGASFDPDMEIENDGSEDDASSEVEDYVVQIAGSYYDNLQAGIQAHQQANSGGTAEEQAAAREEFIQRESEAFAGVVNIITKADEAEEEEILQSVDAILDSNVCLNTVTESIENDESISESVQESTAEMDDATKDEIKAKLDAALLENPENEKQYSYLADLFGITLGN